MFLIGRELFTDYITSLGLPGNASYNAKKVALYALDEHCPKGKMSTETEQNKTKLNKTKIYKTRQRLDAASSAAAGSAC